MLRRFAIYAVVIVAAVGGALFVLTKQSPQTGTSSARYSPSPPRKDWKPSAELDAEANANFSVSSDQKNLVSAAGKHTRSGGPESARDDWPEYNGPERANRSLETGLISHWPKGGPQLVWTSKGMGTGFSTVSVANGVAYTMGNKGSGEAVIAVDAGTGEKIWSTPIAWASHLSMGDGPRGTPTVSGNSVYALGGNGDLASLELSTGKINWRKNILLEFEGTNPAWGICESVLVDENRLICTPGGQKATLAALDPQTGKLLWKSLTPEKDKAGYSSAVVSMAGGVRQYVQFTASGTVGVRAEEGKFLWRDNSAANSTANCSSPLVSGDFVFSSSNYGTGGSLVKLSDSSSHMNSELVYHTSAMISHHGGMVIVDGLLYGSSDPGVLTCLELATGKVKWKNRSVGKGAVTYADGRIYLRSEGGTVALVEATGAGYKELGRFEQPSRSTNPAWAHPVVAEGKLFLRDEDALLCYDLKPAK